MNGTLLTNSIGYVRSGDNVVFNDSETREIVFVVNGKDSDRQEFTMQGLKCIEGTCGLEAVEEVPLEESQRVWSDVENWGGVLPSEGDDVEIPSGWDMVLDIEETPVLNSLTINGRFSFRQYGDLNIHLKARQIFVRAGEFLIGSEEEPFANEAKITLIGDADDETLVLSSTVSAGNKILATVGSIKFYGL